MSINVDQCPLCGSRHSTPFDQRQFRGQQVTNRTCTDCGLVFQSPRMTENELDSFYQEEYRRLYQGSPGPGAKDLVVQAGRAASLLSFVRGYITALTRHLDIGCSAGLLLQQFQAAYGCQSAGVEPGTHYRQYAQDAGLAVYASLEELGAAGQPRYDLVSMAHVLEHLPQPVEYLDNLRQEMVAPGGWLLLEVPNLYAHDSFEVAHLVAFSPHTLRQTVQKAGFEIVALKQHGLPHSGRIPLYLALLARPAARPDSSSYTVIPEGGVRRKRQLGLLRRRILMRLFPRQAWLPIHNS